MFKVTWKRNSFLCKILLLFVALRQYLFPIGGNLILDFIRKQTFYFSFFCWIDWFLEACYSDSLLNSTTVNVRFFLFLFTQRWAKSSLQHHWNRYIVLIVTFLYSTKPGVHYLCNHVVSFSNSRWSRWRKFQFFYFFVTKTF